MSVTVNQSGINLIFSDATINSISIDQVKRDENEFKNKVLDFVNDWLSNKNEFEFQTSGSTGVPKKIIFSRDQIKGSAQLTKRFFQLTRGNKALLCLDPDFVAGKMMLVRALEIGMDIYCISPTSNPLELLSDSIDFAAVVPYQLEAILKSESKNKLDLIKTAIVGGSPVTDSLSIQLQKLPTQFYETYGMTETLTHIAVRKLNPKEDYFQILPGIEISLDERNCLGIRAKHIGNDLIQTNDIAAILQANQFQLLGRYDNIINTAGVKISPEQLESKLRPIIQTLPNSPEYFIAGLKDIQFGEKVILVIEMKELLNESKERLYNLLKTTLKKWELPKEIIAVPSFARTSSGKVSRKETIDKAVNSQV